LMCLEFGDEYWHSLVTEAKDLNPLKSSGHYMYHQI